jgi:glycogen operon protein
VSWHGARLGEPGWHDAGGRLLAFTLAGTGVEADLHAVLNMSDADIGVMLPSIPGRSWHLALDTALESPADIAPPERQRRHAVGVYRAAARSVVVLEARDRSTPENR